MVRKILIMIYFRCVVGGAGFLPSTDSYVVILQNVRCGRGLQALHAILCAEVLEPCLLGCMLPHRWSRPAGSSPHLVCRGGRGF